MNLAAIFGFLLLSLGLPSVGSQPQAPPAQNSQPAQTSPSTTGQTPNPTAPAKPSSPAHRHHKKTTPPCSGAPTPLNTSASNPSDARNADSMKATGPGSGNSDSNNPGSSNSGTTNADSTNAPTNVDSTALKPCPPPKKVVRNGGSDEPAVQLTGDTTAEQASHKRASTEQLTEATEANLKQTQGRQLTPSQQEMVNQIKQFMAQSKTAIAAGDLEGSHNLAMKAHLLSDELVKP
jgi:hypothetical protein